MKQYMIHIFPFKDEAWTDKNDVPLPHALGTDKNDVPLPCCQQDHKKEKGKKKVFLGAIGINIVPGWGIYVLSLHEVCDGMTLQ